MIKYEVLKDEHYIELHISGHASNEIVTSKGENIICAAISAIGQSARIGCTLVSKVIDLSFAKGELDFAAERNDKTEAIINGAYKTIEEIENQYPNSFEVRK